MVGQEEFEMAQGHYKNVPSRNIDSLYRLDDLKERALAYGDEVLEGGYNQSQDMERREKLHREWGQVFEPSTIDAVFDEVLKGEKSSNTRHQTGNTRTYQGNGGHQTGNTGPQY